jgi:HSP20 family protein
MLTKWNSLAIDRMLDDVMGSALGAATHARTFTPAVDVRMREDEIEFIADVPGVKADDVEVTVEKGNLVLRGARSFEAREKEQVMLGRPYGSFTRTFVLPDGVDEDNLTAHLADGVLTVRIPRLPKAKPRRVVVRTEPSSG